MQPSENVSVTTENHYEGYAIPEYELRISNCLKNNSYLLNLFDVIYKINR
ncbi:hypothetical protein NSTCB13_07041 [Nostoc sp. DSM 114160]